MMWIQRGTLVCCRVADVSALMFWLLSWNRGAFTVLLNSVENMKTYVQ